MTRGVFTTSADLIAGPGHPDAGTVRQTVQCRLVIEDAIAIVGVGAPTRGWYLTHDGDPAQGAWLPDGLGLAAELSDQVAIPSGTSPSWWVLFEESIAWGSQTPYWRSNLVLLPIPPYPPPPAAIAGGIELGGEIEEIAGGIELGGEIEEIAGGGIELGGTIAGPTPGSTCPTPFTPTGGVTNVLPLIALQEYWIDVSAFTGGITAQCTVTTPAGKYVELTAYTGSCTGLSISFFILLGEGNPPSVHIFFGGETRVLIKATSLGGAATASVTWSVT